MATFTEFISRLEGVSSTGNGQYVAHCPGHPDKHRSFSFCVKDGRIMGRCFTCCDFERWSGAMGYTARDLWVGGGSSGSSGKSKKSKPKTAPDVPKYSDDPSKIPLAELHQIIDDGRDYVEKLIAENDPGIMAAQEELRTPFFALFAVANLGAAEAKINANGEMTDGPHLFFCEKDTDGIKIGVSRRYPKWAADIFHKGDNKLSMEGTRRALYYSEDWDKFPGMIWNFEGGSDTSLAYACQLAAVGRFSVSGGDKFIIPLLHQSVSNNRKIAFSVENDPSGAGLTGSTSVGQKVADAHGVAVFLYPVPDGHKDFRAFITANCDDYNDLAKLAAAGQLFVQKCLDGPVIEIHPQNEKKHTHIIHVHQYEENCCISIGKIPELLPDDSILVGKNPELLGAWLPDNPLSIGKNPELPACECDKHHICDLHAKEYVPFKITTVFGRSSGILPIDAAPSSGILPTGRMRESQAPHNWEGPVPDYTTALISVESDPLFHRGLFCARPVNTFLLGVGPRTIGKFGIIKSGCHKPGCHACDCRKRREKYEEIVNCINIPIKAGGGVAYRHVKSDDATIDNIRHCVKDAGCESKTIKLATGGALVIVAPATEDGQLMPHRLPAGFTPTDDPYRMVQIALSNMDAAVSTPVTSTQGWEYKELVKEIQWQVIRKSYEPFAPSIWILQNAGFAFQFNKLHGPRIELSAVAQIPPDWTAEQVLAAVECASLGIEVPADRKVPPGWGKYAKHFKPAPRRAA